MIVGLVSSMIQIGMMKLAMCEMVALWAMLDLLMNLVRV
jgi:hypothetical protein